MFDITGRPSDELKHILRKLQANDPGGAKRRRILTYLTKVRTLCARAYGAPTIRGPIADSYLSFLPTRPCVRVHMRLLPFVDQLRTVIYLFCLLEYIKLALFGSQE